MKKILLTCFLFGITAIIQAQVVKVESKKDEQKKELIVKLKDGKQPDVYIDGKKYDSEILRLLDTDKIESLSVIKHEKALKEYNAPNGVILIKTKKEKSEITIKENGVESNIGGDPKIIIDGVVSNQKALKELPPDEIHSINVIKDEKASKEYNAPNGVIIVTTKKKHKEKK